MNNMEKPSMEIDVLSLLKKLWTKKFLIIFMALLFGTLALLSSIFLIKPSYTASTALLIVLCYIYNIVFHGRVFKEGVSYESY